MKLASTISSKEEEDDSQMRHYIFLGQKYFKCYQCIMNRKKSWGGKWTEEKLDAFEKYVKAYLTIMNTRRDACGWKLLYFDGFAGSGSRNLEEEKEEVEYAADLFGQEVTIEDFNVYQGAAERVVKIEGDSVRSFDHFYFVDKNEANCKALEERLANYETTGKKHYMPMNANVAVKMLSGTLRKYGNYKALAFLDPFGMQIDWTSIESLKDLPVDLWILVPTGVIINRLLERKVDQEKGLTHAEKLESFFGMTETEIKSFFYIEKPVQTLFGEEEIITKAENSIRRIAQLYVKRLQDVFPYVTEDPMVLYNTHNVPIFHLVFAAKNKTAMKIAQEIINKQ